MKPCILKTKMKYIFMKTILIMVSLFICTVNLKSQDVGDGLVGWWKLDEQAGTQAYDASGLGNTGTLKNGAKFILDGQRNAVLFNDQNTVTNGVVELPLNQSLNLTNKTLVFWARVDSRDGYYNMIFGHEDSRYITFVHWGNYNGLAVHWTNANGQDEDTEFPIPLNLGEWTFYAIVYNVNGSNVTMSLYRNEQPVGSPMIRNSGFISSPVVFVGARSVGSGSLVGALDNIKIYNRPLSEQDIQKLYSGIEPAGDTQAPTIPANLRAVRAECNIVDLAWDASIDDRAVAGYRIYRDGNFIGTSPSITFTDLSAEPLTTYEYRVSACDGANNEGEKSAPLPVTTTAKPVDWPTARIHVEPSTNVEVGDLVYFDGTNSTDDQPFMAADATENTFETHNEALFEWDFGDGYTFKRGSPTPLTYNNGIAVVHYYMNPGTYTATLTLTDIDDNADAETVMITVTGQAAMQGFELLHAPYHARIGQYIYAQIPASVRSNRLRVSIVGDNGYSAVLFDKTGLNTEEKFLLNNSILPQGNYTVLAEVLNGASVVTYIKEKFPKPYSGVPRVGIDENNAMCVNGTPIFPVTPWMIGSESFPEWSGRYLNTLYVEGWYETHTANTWKDYLNIAARTNPPLSAIGPGRWDGAGPANHPRNSDVNSLVNYVTTNRDNSGLFAWMWADEPNMGGRFSGNPSQILSAWTYKTHQNDPQHPVSTQLYGFEYLPYSGGAAAGYDYMLNAEYFGGKKHFPTDITGADIYPLESQHHISLVDPNRGVIDLWIQSIDNMVSNNYDLIPAMQFIETQDVFGSDDARLGGRTWTPGPTPEQLRMEYWLSVVHGMKGINLFHFFTPIPLENYGVMSEFFRHITDLTPVVLGAKSERTVTDNANTRGNRVDNMIRETDTDIYVFAVRLTEPDTEWDEVMEPETINTNFTLSGTLPAGSVASVYGKQNKHEVQSVNTASAYTFTLSNAPIDPGSIIMTGYTRTTYSNDSFPDRLFDNGEGIIFGYHKWTNASINVGTIDYASGLITVNLANYISEWTSANVTYQPAESSPRTISVTNGQFSDTFEREAVRIYKIKKSNQTGANPELPREFAVSQNYPNPFNPTTKIQFTVPSDGHVRIRVYNCLGQIVATPFEGEVKAGQYQTVQIDGTSLSSGVYFYYIEHRGQCIAKPMVLIK